MRDGKEQVVSVRPKYDAAAGQTLVGFGFGSEPTGISAGEALDRASGVDLDDHLENRHRSSPTSSNRRNASRSQASSAPATSPIRRSTSGSRQALLLLAIVSLSLGLVNLLPILPLDGGHIFWAIVEKLRGEPVSLRVMERASMIGFALVAMLFFIGLSNDIGRITGEGFNVR